MLTEPVIYTRDFAKEHPESLFIFTDNTDRSSGPPMNIIDPDSWYAKKYGQGLKYPNITTAQVRGLNNCYPISTQRWYHKGAKGANGRWHDSDFDIFKQIVDDEVNDIFKALRSGKYRQVIFCSEIINGHISQITKERTPKLYAYLVNKIKTIKDIYCKPKYVQGTLF